jgi:hypothetical protein
MKKHLLILFSVLLLYSGEINAQVSARTLDGSYSWWNFQTLKLESKIELYGLLYETTLDVKIKLGKQYDYYYNTCQEPYHGKYEFEWNFTLPQNAYIKQLAVWNNSSQSFVSASDIDLTTAENEYQPGMDDSTRALLRQYMRRDYNGSYNQYYDLKISPVNWDEAVEFIIKYISPCTMYYNKRVVEDHSSQFYTYSYGNCYTSEPATFSVIDYNNPNSAPSNFSGFSGDWNKEGNFWISSIGQDNYYSDIKLSFPAETESGKFLRTYQDTYNNFYQLTTKPFINDELRYPKKIVVAFDLKQQYFKDYYYNNYSRIDFLNMIKNALMISTTEKDSLIFVTSDFNVHWLENNFEPVTENLITSGINSVNQIIPKLNTLPYMLKEIVQFLNDKGTDAEVWLVSDDDQTGVRAETVMELLQQTYYAAKHKIVFNIADATEGYHSYYIQNKYYKGNEYLYENLTRLSGGNFNKLYDKYYLNFIDEILDCWAPKVTTVEIDPLPQSGITYSRINANNGINNFNITSRYGELGIYEGSTPFDINYYGYYLGDGYFNNINVDEDNTEISDYILENTGLYWYGNYIMQELFLQPQSNSTIKYIEDLSVKNHLLTPYSGFIIPGPSGYTGFQRIYLDQQTVSVKNDDVEKQKRLPSEISLQSYPNPFNPTTTIVMKLGSSSFNTKKSLDIYNILGKKVKTFDLSEYDYSGEIRVVWNGLNDNGGVVSSGIYIAVLKTGTQIKSLKLTLIR